MINIVVPHDIIYKYWYSQPQLVSAYLFLQLHSQGEEGHRTCTFSMRELAQWTGVKSGVNGQGIKYGYVFDNNGIMFQTNPTKVGRPSKEVPADVEANEQPILTIGKNFNVIINDQHEITVTWESPRPYKFLYINGDEIENFEFRDKANYLSVFLTSILTAAFHVTQYRGDKVERGHVITSNANIQSLTGLTRQQIRTILAKLTETKHIMVKTFTDGDKHLHKGFDMTVCAYDKYVATKTVSKPKKTVVYNAIYGIITNAKVENYIKIKSADGKVDRLVNYFFNEYNKFIPGTSFAAMSEEQQAQQLLDNWEILKRPWNKDASNSIKVQDIINPNNSQSSSNNNNYGADRINSKSSTCTPEIGTQWDIESYQAEGIAVMC